SKEQRKKMKRKTQHPGHQHYLRTLSSTSATFHSSIPSHHQRQSTSQLCSSTTPVRVVRSNPGENDWLDSSSSPAQHSISFGGAVTGPVIVQIGATRSRVEGRLADDVETGAF